MVILLLELEFALDLCSSLTKIWKQHLKMWSNKSGKVEWLVWISSRRRTINRNDVNLVHGSWGIDDSESVWKYLLTCINFKSSENNFVKMQDSHVVTIQDRVMLSLSKTDLRTRSLVYTSSGNKNTSKEKGFEKKCDGIKTFIQGVLSRLALLGP